MADLLIQATAELLDGWCGPVVVLDRDSGMVSPALCLGWPVSTSGTVALVSVADTPTPFVVGLRHVRLDLSRAECRDRAARVLMDAPGRHTAPDWTWHHIADPKRPLPAWASSLDMTDRTRLADGSALVDARALKLCWEASRV